MNCRDAFNTVCNKKYSTHLPQKALCLRLLHIIPRARSDLQGVLPVHPRACDVRARKSLTRRVIILCQSITGKRHQKNDSSFCTSRTVDRLDGAAESLPPTRQGGIVEKCDTPSRRDRLNTRLLSVLRVASFVTLQEP